MVGDGYNEDGTRTDAKLAKDYEKMGHSVETINSIITRKKIGGDGSDKDDYVFMNSSTDEDRKKRVEDNVAHLETMKAKTDWKGNEDWTDVDKAITDGKAYVG